MTDTAFERFWALGYRTLLPVVPPGSPLSENSELHKRMALAMSKGDDAKAARLDPRGKSPGIRGADGRWFGFNWRVHETSERDLTRWSNMGASLGLRTGEQPDGTWLVLIDADTLDKDHATTIARAVGEHLGALPIRIGRSPKAGYVARVAGAFPYTQLLFGDERVEILTRGQQFVAHGVHPKTGKPYAWPSGVPAYADIPVLAPGALHAFMAALKPLLPEATLKEAGGGDAPAQDSLKGDPDKLRAAIAATPNSSEHFPSRESWVQYGYAIKAAFGPEHEAEGLDAFLEWSGRWDSETDANDLDAARSEWARMKPPFRTGAHRIFATAADLSNGAFTAGDRYFVEPTPEQIALQRTETKVETRPLTLGAVTLDDLGVPPREWLYGRKILRKYVGTLFAPGGVGKSSWVFGMALACASGAKLLHDRPHKKLRVCVYNLEDDIVELRRRLEAAFSFYDLPPDTLDNIRLSSGRDRGLQLAKLGPNGDVMETGDKAALITAMRTEKIDILVVDPALRSHGLTESNEHQDAIYRIYGEIAEATNAAVFLVSHTRKGAVAGDAESVRGGSAQIGGARSMFSLTAMTPEEAKSLAIPLERRKLYVRLDDAKENMAPPMGSAEWLHLHSVRLGNGTDEYPEGDSVQAITPWQAPEPTEGLEDDDIGRVIALIGAGLPDGERYGKNKNSGDRWAGRLVSEELSVTEEHAQRLLKVWTAKGGLLEERAYWTKRSRNKVNGLFVTAAESRGDNVIEAADMFA